MAQKTYCDRCGVEIAHEPWNANTSLYREPNPKKGATGYRYAELCRPCVEDWVRTVKDWLAGGRAQWPEPTKGRTVGTRG